MQPPPGHKLNQPLHELQQRDDQMRGAVASGGLQLEHQLAGGVGLHAFVGQRRAGDVASDFLEHLGVIGARNARQ